MSSENEVGNYIIPYGYKYRGGRLVKVERTNYTFQFTFPSDFILVIDTREQSNLFKRPPKGLVVVRDTLSAGDYSIRGFESCIAVERKTVDDLWSSVTVHHERFKRELSNLMMYERKWLVIEGLESEYLRPDLAGRDIHPNAVRQALASIEAKWGVPIKQFESRKSLERWMLDVFVKYFIFRRTGQ